MTAVVFAPPAWLSVKDLAVYLGWNERRVWNERFRKHLPPGKHIVGVGLRFRKTDIDYWLKTGNITRAKGA